MKKIFKIIYLVASPFNERDFQRFGVEVFIKNGFDVYVWDFSPFIYKEAQEILKPPDPIEFENLIRFFSQKDAIDAIREKGNNSFIISLLPYLRDTYKIFKVISKNKIPYSVRYDANPFVENNPYNRSFLRRAARITPGKVIYYLKNAPIRLKIGLFKNESATFVILGGARSVIDKSRVNQKTQKIWAHALDYDFYLNDQKSDARTEDIAIFVDIYLPFHPDILQRGMSAPVATEEYYSLLCNFFDCVEEKLGIKVVIAAHPRSHYEEEGDFFQGRRIARGKTSELVRKAKFVILHYSTAINFPVLYKKPMIFVTTESLLMTIFGRKADHFASYFGKTPINISRELNIDLEDELFVDEEKYDKFKHDFIKKEGSEELPYWQIVSKKIKELEI